MGVKTGTDFKEPVLLNILNYESLVPLVRMGRKKLTMIRLVVFHSRDTVGLGPDDCYAGLFQAWIFLFPGH